MTVLTAETSAPRVDAARSIWRSRWRRFRRHKGALVSLFVMAFLVLFAVFAAPFEAFMETDATKVDLLSRFDPPSAAHWLGTDELGRDVLVRLMYGGQVSLAVGLLATVVGGAFGVAVGLFAGYFGGKVDSALMRITDGFISLPLLPLLIVFAAVDLTKLGFTADFARSPEAGFLRIIVIISLVDWTPIARLVRAATLSVREREFVLAAKVSGAGAMHVMVRHVLPNIVTPIIVNGTQTVGKVILFESVLSFLGFGIVPPTPSWGNMLNNAQELISSAPMLAIYPGLLIFITVIVVNFIGDGLQDAFDPKAQEH